MLIATSCIRSEHINIYAQRALSGYAEGNLKWSYLPRNEQALGFATSVVDPSTGLINEQCSIMPIYVFTEDHKATTLNTVISSLEEYNEKYIELYQLYGLV